ncbi:LPS assembly lipoprotein LptE [Gracilimonas mengyeensis]|uniref:Lipopolysaccharide-assembly n=1 Tax=Gracilimonas mengyeensis TaxID=1302730 RepID=A0A521F6B1_9BACT|nr:LptE family protein [Gracilimonas mengyeensis]SMO91161.1 Lipopolysaccharide-assembly [Gracilimonas mengyeensis]
MGSIKLRWFVFLITALSLTGCLRYSFTGASIPPGVNTIFIPFFPDQSNSGLGDLSDRLNQALIERFVNQSKLQLANSEEDADAVLDGVITGYSNRPFSIGGDERANQNQVRITVRASFVYASEEEPEWNKSFTGEFTYDPNENPIEGEDLAADGALEQVANNMFNDAVSNW